MTYNNLEQLFNTIMQLRTISLQTANESHEEKAATMLQFSALNFLKDQSIIAVGELAQFLRLSKSSATQLIERLVTMGLVKRSADKEDRRVIRVTLTSKGDSELILLRKKIMKKMNHFASKIPKKDIEELLRITTNLIETLNKGQS